MSMKEKVQRLESSETREIYDSKMMEEVFK